ncbi:hypothetical protein BKA62DRAFT_830786 [Auriculariales sp. MPI-PUGE-AT-0066]|nr:hypothetical protein BKA62DRAFT_830786 [Auriculariales sp. MPI-PUGE-AT-0066]
MAVATGVLNLLAKVVELVTNTSYYQCFYFLSRYSMLFALIGMVAMMSIHAEINCQALISFIHWAGITAIGASTNCLMMRTIAIWEKRLIVTVPLVLISLGHCAYYITVSPRFTQSGYRSITSVVFFTIAVRPHSNLVELLFSHGVVYFLATFSVNLIAAVFNLMNLNPVMNIIAIVPAATVSTVAATRCVVSLSTYRDSQIVPTVTDGRAMRRFGPTLAATRTIYPPNGQELGLRNLGKHDHLAMAVHVEREVTITVAESRPSSPGMSKSHDLESGKGSCNGHA